MTSISATMLRDLDGYVAAAMHDWGLPGLALAAVKDGEVVLAKGYGVREAGRPEAVDEHTLFGVGSNTKAFTATALGLLVQEGRLDWDDAVVERLPGFRFGDPYVTQAMTVRDLLCHRSGLATYAGDVLFYGEYPPAETVRRLRHVRPAYGFRSRYGYSNLMFLTAGEIVPAITGMSWDDFVTERIFRPLGMARTTPGVTGLRDAANVAVPHTWIAGRLTTMERLNSDHMGPAASINSSAWDMARWLLLQLGGGELQGRRLVERDIIEETRTPHTPIPPDAATRRLFPWQHFSAYGLGWSLADYRGRLLIGHGGHVDGMVSRSGFLPEENLGVIVLTNDERNELKNALLFQAIDALIGAPAQDWSAAYLREWRAAEARQAEAEGQAEAARVKGTRPSVPLEHLLGAYANPVLGEAQVTQTEKGLRFQAVDHPLLGGELEHWHYDTFRCKWKQPGFHSTLVSFRLDGAGQVEELKVKFREDWIDPIEYLFARL